jgi:hypothetical protein
MPHQRGTRTPLVRAAHQRRANDALPSLSHGARRCVIVLRMGERISLEAVAAEYRATRVEAASLSSLRLRWKARRMARGEHGPTDQLDLARRAAVRDELVARGERTTLR